MTKPHPILFALLAFIFIAGAGCSIFQQGDGCPVDVRPAIPVLLEVKQDPETLTVTATVRDESDNEQWFALERTLITPVNPVVVVGTDIPVPDKETLPLSKEKGRILTITDRGIVEDQKPIPGQEYVYMVRAWNCYAPSAQSNYIKILSLFPS